ncbi:MAG: hypothetical protein HOY79_00600 [Streptomyces sp.]|nr:hypothetical protein [Streptomyces sp.]
MGPGTAQDGHGLGFRRRSPCGRRALARLDISQVWGDGTTVAADGTSGVFSPSYIPSAAIAAPTCSTAAGASPRPICSLIPAGYRRRELPVRRSRQPSVSRVRHVSGVVCHGNVSPSAMGSVSVPGQEG